MNILKISLANLKFRSLSSFFNVIILALGIATVITLLQISNQIEERFQKDLHGVDLVVGAKGSPIQLILSSVFHLDIPTGNIPLDEAEKLAKNPLIKKTIPLALGDNYNGFRIVGTNADYINHYDGKLANGRIFGSEMEVVVGSEVLKINKLKLGDQIIGAHGLVNSDDLHSDSPYTIVGTLKPTGTVLDRLVLTPVESVWHTHEHSEDEEHGEEHEDHKEDGEHAEHEEHGNHEEHEDKKELTSLLISYKTPMATITLPRLINKTSSMQAASPAFEMARLIKILGVGTDGIKLFAIVLITIAAIGFFITLFNAVNDQRYEIALMRSLGATRGKILSFVIVEGLILGALGTFLGVILGHIFSYIAKIWIEQTRHVMLNSAGFSLYEVYIVIAALAISLIAAIIPAFMAYKVNAAKILSKGK